MFRNSVTFFIISVIALSTFSCSKYQKIQKSQDFSLKYEKALEYYEKEDYYRALNLFDQVMPFYRGTEEAENIAYKYAYAYYNQHENIMASYYFDRFAKTFPRSEKAQECAFMAAYCKYQESPRYELDQTTTKEAINDLQLFINNYPYSDSVETCNNLIDELREKIQKKEFEIARLYLKMDKFQAAVTSFDNLLNDYPDTKFREDAMYYTIKSYYYYASKSVKSKSRERYQEAADMYDKFIAQYPDSKYSREAQYMYDRAQKELEN